MWNANAHRIFQTLRCKKKIIFLWLHYYPLRWTSNITVQYSTLSVIDIMLQSMNIITPTISLRQTHKQRWVRRHFKSPKKKSWSSFTPTVATILFTAAADSSSPLGWSTSVMPRWQRLKVIPSKMVSRVSVQFSGSSTTKKGCCVEFFIFFHLKLSNRSAVFRMISLYVTVWKYSFSLRSCMLEEM